MKTKYIVVSPEMWEIVPCLDYGEGPKEYFRDCVEVFARDPLEAKVKAVRTKSFQAWNKWQKSENLSPYIGLKAIRIYKKGRNIND